MFAELKRRQAELDEFLVNPFEVEEGVLECACGSRKTFSYQKQTRAADESATTFAQCVTCGKRWTYSG